jgi:transcription factor SPN1
MSDSDADSQPTTPLPEAGDDLGDPNRAMSEDRDTSPPPAANPDLDMDNAENDNDDDLSDNESELSEVDEAEFAEFDPTTVALEDRPLVGIDEDIARTLKAGKRKRADKDGDGRKPKEAKRDKKKKSRRDDDEDPDGELVDGKRVKKPKRIDGERKDRDKAKERRPATPENEENLTPEERRRRALDKAMDAALKNPNKRRRKKDEVVCTIYPCLGINANPPLGSRRSFR